MNIDKDVAKDDYVMVGIYLSLRGEEHIPYLDEFRITFTVGDKYGDFIHS